MIIGSLLADIALTTLELIVLSVPLMIGGWAFLDAAYRPRWVWAFSGRRQVIWLSVLFFAALSGLVFGALTMVPGVAISLYYLVRIRRGLKGIEAGNVR